MKNVTMIALATMMLSAPAFAQAPATPSGKSDTTSNGDMKSGDATMKSGEMKSGSASMMKNGATNGTSTLAGPAGKMSDPSNK